MLHEAMEIYLHATTMIKEFINVENAHVCIWRLVSRIWYKSNPFPQ
jgi:hypothetical protein